MSCVRAAPGSNSPRTFQRQAGFIQIQAHPVLFLVLCLVLPILVVGTGAVGFWLGGRTATAEQRAVLARVPSLQHSSTPSLPFPQYGFVAARKAAGPWGDIICERVIIEAPDECLPSAQTEIVPKWFFNGYSSETLLRLFAEAGLTETQRSDLLRTNGWQISPAGIYVQPLPETVLTLSLPSRKKIYEVLSLFPENPNHARPFYWRADETEAIFSGAPISVGTRSEVLRLAYPRGKLMLFSDLPTLLAKLPTDAERCALRKALSRQFGILMRLGVSPGADIDALIRYWGIAGLAKKIRPAIEAAARIPEGRQIPVLGLLPPSARSRLYTFPIKPNAVQLDGYWTALNFFRETPDTKNPDIVEWSRQWRAEYHPLDSDPRYGDLLILTRSEGQILHACVYLANDVVYTKNGAGQSAPWMLMKIEDLLDHFAARVPEGERLRTTYIRNKNL